MLFRRVCAFFTFIAITISSWFGLSHTPYDPIAEDEFQVVSYVVANNIQNLQNLHTEDFDIITHVILFGCATFDQDGIVHLETETLENALTNLRTTIGERDVTITINLLGPGPAEYTDWYDQMDKQADLHTEAFKSGILEENIRQLVDEYGLDGVHFDYEYPIKKKAWSSFNAFLIQLREQLPDSHIGIAVSNWDVGLSTRALSAIDSIELMLYDNYDSEGRHSTYETATQTASSFLKEFIPPEMVTFGLPFYARPTDSGAYWYSYSSYCDLLDADGYYYDEAIDKTFWFNTPEVIASKTEYALQNGFGGVMIWHYTCDFPSSDPNSLLRAIGTAIDSAYN